MVLVVLLTHQHGNKNKYKTSQDALGENVEKRLMPKFWELEREKKNIACDPGMRQCLGRVTKIKTAVKPETKA